jgi:hypothetical protein
MAVTVTIRTVDDQVVPVGIVSVLVSIFNSTGTTFITSGTTAGVAGEVQFSLPGSVGGITYVARLFKAGVSFLPTPTKTFVAKDPPAGPDFNTFQYTGHVGMVGVVATFVVKDTASPTPNPVEDVRIRIFSSPADLYITELETDSNGEAEVVLEGAASPTGKEYIIRVNTPVGYYDGPTKTIAVIDPLGPTETNIFDFIAYPPPTVPVTADIDMCRLSGFFTDPSLRPLKNLVLLFHPKEGYPKYVIAGFPFSGNPTVVKNKIIASERRANTDKNGYIELDLARGSTYDVFAQGLDAPDHTLLGQVYVPDAAGISIHEVLFPYLKKITYTPATLALTVGQTDEIEVAMESSNLQPMSGKAFLEALLVFTTSDPTKAIVAITNEGTLRVTALAAGVVTIQAERVVGSFAPRRPAVAALIVAPSVPTITVT